MPGLGQPEVGGSVQRSQAERRSGPLTRFDLVFSALLALYSMMFFAGVWGATTPFVFLGGDTANIASFAAGWWHPETFIADPVLGNLDNYRVYMVVHIPLLEPLAWLAGDYGTAFVLLLAPHVFLQGLGFYTLGRVLFRSQYWAALLAIASAMTVHIPIIAEYWGIFPHVQPRFSFQALLPWLLVLVVVWRARPERWHWLMILAGSLVYVHPVSAPAWGLAIWLSLWLCHPAHWSPTERIGRMLWLGGLFVAVIAPFAYNYFVHFEHGPTSDYELMIDTFRRIYAPGYLELPKTIGLVTSDMLRRGLLPFGIVGVTLAFALRPQDRRVLLLAGAWLVGVLLVSTVLPLVEHELSRRLQRLPGQLDLVRGVRYMIPLSLLFGFWGMAAIQARLPKRHAQLVIGAIGLGLTVAWSAQNPPLGGEKALDCLARGRILCGNAGDHRLIAALKAVQQRTEPEASILPALSRQSGGGLLKALAVRYHARRSVVYLGKDRGILGYSNHAALLRWIEKDDRMKAIMAARGRQRRTRNLVRQAGEWGADYLLVRRGIRLDRETLKLLETDIIYENNDYKLVKLNSHVFRADRINGPVDPVVGVCQENGSIKLYTSDANGRTHVVAAASQRSLRHAADRAKHDGPVTIVEKDDIHLLALPQEQLELRAAGGFAVQFSATRCAVDSREGTPPTVPDRDFTG